MSKAGKVFVLILTLLVAYIVWTYIGIGPIGIILLIIGYLFLIKKFLSYDSDDKYSKSM